MRTITNSWYRAHTTPIFKSLNILKINYLYWLMVLKFCYRIENKLLPSYLDEFIQKNLPVVQFIGVRRIFSGPFLLLSND